MAMESLWCSRHPGVVSPHTGTEDPLHKCETKHSCKSMNHCVQHPHYMTKLQQQGNQNWPGCLVRGAKADMGGEW